MTSIRQQIESAFISHDSTELFYRRWEPANTSNKALIIIHRGHEHSGRVQGLIDDLNLPNHWAFAYDARGHGNSPGKRGDAESFNCMVRDLDEFTRHITSKYEIEIKNIIIVANSVGAVIAATWVHDYAPKVRGMVLAAPAFRIKLYVPLALPSLRMLMKIRPNSFITSYIRPGMLTHDKEQATLYAADPMVTKAISVRILIGLHDASTRILDDAKAINTPTMVLSSGSDFVVKNNCQRKFYNSLSSAVKEFHHLDGFYHALFYEKDRAKPVSLTREFIEKLYKQEYHTPTLTDSDKLGFTKDEYDRLSKPLGFFRNLPYAIQVMSMKSLGRLSKGIRLGLETGFDSGESLDYVYQNKAEGITPIGKLIDLIYLEAIGWKGIRKRKVNILKTISESIDAVIQNGDKAKIIDIASGPGRYIIETAADKGEKIEHVLLRDYKQQNLDAANRLAEKLSLKNIKFEQADAFDPLSYNTIEIKPNIAVCSGLFELFPENDKITTALTSLSSIMESGCHLIYTSQPWHPQVEMIARTLINHQGRYWVMRRRTQVEMDQLVEQAGFNKIHTKVGPYGIFNVSVAEKV